VIARAKRLEKIPPYLFGEIAALKRKALAEGKDLIDMGIGDPDQPTPESIITALNQASQNPETHRYDETNAGWIPFLEAVSAFCGRRFGISIDPTTEAMLLIGSKEGLAHIAWSYIDPGDISLVPDPAYTVYKVNTLMAGGDVHTLPLREENGFLPDLAAVPSDVAKKAKLLWLNYPNNPTGAVASRDFYSQAVAFARDYDLLIVNDAAYSEVYYDAYRPPSILQVPGGKEVAVELHSLSKSFNMTGWRLGFAIGNADAIATLNKLKSNLDSKQFPAVSLAGAHALLKGDNSATLDLYKRRRDILCNGLNAVGWKVPTPQATFYVWARVPTGQTSAEFARTLLEEASVNVIPGSGYGEYGEGYVRMSLTVLGDKNGERLQEAVTRIGKALHAEKG
jgi:LL-diaminopimelate aminotransferase